jgi:integrase
MHHHFKFTLQDSKWDVVRGFHALRHSFASNLARSGKVPRDTIAKWMGHTTEEMKDLYQHLFPQDGQSQINVLK